MACAPPRPSFFLLCRVWVLFVRLQDGVVELVAGGSKHCEGLVYAAFFIVSAALVSLHTCFCNRGFSTQLRRFVCY